jgi:hypothetical protein
MSCEKMKIELTVGKRLPNELCGKIHLIKDNRPLCGTHIKEQYKYEIKSYLSVEEMVQRTVGCKNCKRIFKCLSTMV